MDRPTDPAFRRRPLAGLRTVLVALAGLAALVAIGALRLDDYATMCLSGAITGICTGVAGRSAAGYLARRPPEPRP